MTQRYKYKKRKVIKKESLMTRIKNWSISILLAGVMLFGLQSYSSTTSLKFAQVSDAHFYTLTSITISSNVLKAVGSSAFKGISAKAVIKVPAAKLSAYQKLLKGKGQKSSVKITK